MTSSHSSSTQQRQDKVGDVMKQLQQTSLHGIDDDQQGDHNQNSILPHPNNTRMRLTNKKDGGDLWNQTGPVPSVRVPNLASPPANRFHQQPFGAGFLDMLRGNSQTYFQHGPSPSLLPPNTLGYNFGCQPGFMPSVPLMTPVPSFKDNIPSNPTAGPTNDNRHNASQTNAEVYWHYNPGPEIYSRKVFVGGLPIDIDDDELNATFSKFGPVVVDWPHKNEQRAYFPPKGYVFLIFEHEPSVQALIQQCHQEDDKYYMCVTSPTMKDKPVQIRPWRLADADFVVDASLHLDPRKTVFIGGVPRPLKAVELATIMEQLYGGVCYAGIDTDPELKYPKGAGRVAFSNTQSYIAAISARFVQLNHSDVDKRVEVKPYVLDDQNCDECGGSRCGGKYAPFFCSSVNCLQYFCEQCWTQIHSRQGREYHKPLVKENVERTGPRSGTGQPIAQRIMGRF